MLFQGAFEEMQSKNESIDPNKLATSLGFAGKTAKTLETGCEIDFHFRRCCDRGNRPQRLRLYAEEAIAACSRRGGAMRGVLGHAKHAR